MHLYAFNYREEFYFNDGTEFDRTVSAEKIFVTLFVITFKQMGPLTNGNATFKALFRTQRYAPLMTGLVLTGFLARAARYQIRAQTEREPCKQNKNHFVFNIRILVWRETMYKLLSLLLNSDTFISTYIWLAEPLTLLHFHLNHFIYFRNIYLTNISIYFVFTAWCQYSCACYHKIVYVYYLK